MKNKDLIKKGKYLAFLLRHDTEYQFDEHGWREVSDLIKNQGYTMKEIEEIVETNNKQRYEFSNDKKKIRARQGHSIPVDVELKEATPPDVLYHGTAKNFVGSIWENGIKKMSRLYVHLSDDEETARKVGQRHGYPVVIFINAKQMKEDGIKFYLSNNNVWLTDFVDKKYLMFVQEPCGSTGQ